MTHLGAVTGSSAAAVEAGEKILRAGGNAVDAAVAVALASCVADPCNTGLGGFGGFMIVDRPGEAPQCVDFGPWAPVQALASLKPSGDTGPAASVIPNVVAGLSRALSAFGSMSWSSLVEPALALATDGVKANAITTQAFAEAKGESVLDDCFMFEKDGAEGFRFRQPALAATLRRLSEQGPEWFYEGPIAELGAGALSAGGMPISASHWAEAMDAVRIAPAPAWTLDDWEFCSGPLATSGSACLFATIAAGATLLKSGASETPRTVLDWAQRLVSLWSYRFGTAHGNDISLQDLPAWIARALAFDLPVTVPADAGHTCHFNVADRHGMLVACTFTHGRTWFGARWALPGTGVIMNIGRPTVAEHAPKIVDGRARGIANMCPAVARGRSGARLAAGCPGARRIPTIIGLTLTRHLFGRRPLGEAISMGRFHAETRDRATLESGRWDASVRDALRRGFAAVEEEGPAEYYGPFTAIRREADGAFELGLDDRWPGRGAILS